MKKLYIVPEMETVSMGKEVLLEGSVVDNGLGIGYGGKDKDGDLTPNVHEETFSHEWQW